MKHEKISHDGVVQAIHGKGVSVKILQTSACAACKVHGFCSAAESKEKIVEVSNTQHMPVAVGDNVTVAMEAQRGRDAVLLAFVIPFAVMVTTLVACLKIWHSEPVAALAAIAILIPYYAILYAMKDRLKRKFNFVMENN